MTEPLILSFSFTDRRGFNMSELDNMSEATNEANQPSEAVEATLEESQSTPQDSDTGEELFFAEDEGDHNQPNSNMTQEQTYAAWRKEQEKRKRKNEELEAAKKREQELIDRLASVESKLGNVARGPKPTLESCDYDEDAFYKAYDEWQSHGTAKPATTNTDQPVNNQQQVMNPVNDEADFYHHLKSTELKEKLPDFDEQASKVQSKINSVTGNKQNTEMFMQNMRAIAHRRGIDIAKAEYALGRSDVLFEKLKATRDQYDIEDVLREAAGKIQTRERKAPESQPTPTIGGGGTIDNYSVAIKKAQDKYAETGRIEDYNALRKARQAAKK